jgi:predicted AlkP superfamily phosphohydrolase/phosphomutase
VIIGIDGGEFKVLRSMMRRGVMPNLSTIMKQASYGDLDTYVDPMGQGWASLMTGKSPLKHRIYYWNLHGLRSSDIRGPKIWNVVNAAGLKVGIMNVSYTFPPDKVNGFFISGLGGGRLPSKDVLYCHPEDLLDDLKSNVGEYIWGATKSMSDSPEEILGELIEMERRRGDSGAYLMEKYDCDLSIVVFRGSDALQHSFWNYLDEDNPNLPGSDEIRILLDEFYRTLDHAILKVSQVFQNASVFIISDHGFGPTKAMVNINEYLHTMGYLSKSRGIKAQLGNRCFQKIKNVTEPLYKKALANIPFFRRLNELRARRMGKVISAIDFENTISYADDLNYASLRINSTHKDFKSWDKETFLCRIEQLIDDLLTLKCPLDGKQVFKRVFLKENSNLSDYERVPEILLEPNEQFHISPEINVDENGEIFKNMATVKMKKFTGSHRRMGIFISFGRGLLKKGEIKDLKITDIMPTALRILGLEIPQDIDGTLIKDIFPTL